MIHADFCTEVNERIDKEGVFTIHMNVDAV